MVRMSGQVLGAWGISIKARTIGSRMAGAADMYIYPADHSRIFRPSRTFDIRIAHPRIVGSCPTTSHTLSLCVTHIYIYTAAARIDSLQKT